MNDPRQSCGRCGQQYRGRDDWNAVLRHGVVVGLVCPICQSAEENAEAVINEATIDYGRDQLGRLTGKAKA